MRPRSDDLPGDLMIWVLIVSELLVFGAGLLAFLAVRLTDPAGFAVAQDQLHRVGAGINTLILITSGWLAARGGGSGPRQRPRSAPTATCWRPPRSAWCFLVIKGSEFADLAALGIGTETHPFFTFYFLLTGFHAAHVLAGVVLGLLAWRPLPYATENGVAFWHMVDLVWVILFPVIYLVR